MTTNRHEDVVVLLDKWDTEGIEAVHYLKKWDTEKYKPVNVSRYSKSRKPKSKVIAASVAVAIAGFALSPATLTFAATNDMIEIKQPSVDLNLPEIPIHKPEKKLKENPDILEDPNQKTDSPLDELPIHKPVTPSDQKTETDVEPANPEPQQKPPVLDVPSPEPKQSQPKPEPAQPQPKPEPIQPHPKAEPALPQPTQHPVVQPIKQSNHSDSKAEKAEPVVLPVSTVKKDIQKTEEVQAESAAKDQPTQAIKDGASTPQTIQDGQMPKTATNYPTMVLGGAIGLAVGGLLLVRRKPIEG